jgi:ABC-2 type transport system ATP-binding protein
LQYAHSEKEPGLITLEDPSDAPPLEVLDLSKRYKDGAWANRNISLTVERGEVLCILGPNGAGKTTLVRQVTTELLPTSGDVRVMGYSAVSEPSRVKSLMGTIPQEAALYWGLSVWHHLRAFGRLHGLSRKQSRDRAEELIESLRLQAHRDKMPEDLSGGLRRRVLVGIAVLARPALMVLDEPTTGLDPQSRRDLWSVLARYKAEGTAILLTTHYMEEAEELSDRVGVMNEGRLLAIDSIDALRSTHNLEFKATFQDGGGEAQTIYGKDSRDLSDRIRALGVEEFSISRANLEDVYFALTGKGFTDETAT